MEGDGTFEERALSPGTTPNEEEIENSVIEEINREYPTAESLVGLDVRLSEVSVQLQETEQSILSAVRRQAELTHEQPHERPSNLEKSTEQKVKELLELCKTVRETAATTDKDVATLCAGLKMLDTAKLNLTKSITTLKQALMLAAATNQLREAARRRKYKEAAQLVQASLPLQSAFSAYSHVPSVNMLLSQLQQLREALLQQVQEDFEAALDPDSHAQSPPLSPEETKTLLEAAQCIDSLGLPFARHQLVGAVCSALLTPYCRLFHPTASSSNDIFDLGGVSGSNEEVETGARLDRVDPKGLSNFLERRFSWLRRTLREFDSGAGCLFPLHWCIKEKLAEAFCRVTRQHLADALGGAQPSAPPHRVLSLVKEMQLFEQRLESRFSAERKQLQLLVENAGQSPQEGSASISLLPRVLAHATVEAVQTAAREEGATADFPGGDSFSSEAERLAQAVATDESLHSADRNALPLMELPPPVCFRGILTSSLDFFLTGWAPFEEQQLQQRLQRALSQDKIITHGRLDAGGEDLQGGELLQNETNPFAEDLQTSDTLDRPQPLNVASGDDVGCLYTSATEVFVACKGALERTSAVSTQQTLAEVVACFKRLLERYFAALQKRLPSNKAFSNSAFSKAVTSAASQAGCEASSSSTSKEATLLCVCAVVCTCEYCVELLTRLQEAVEAKIASDFTERCSFDAQRELLWSLHAEAVRLLLLPFNAAVRSAFPSLQKQLNRKSTEKLPSEVSASVAALLRSLQAGMQILAPLLTRAVFRFLSNKVAELDFILALSGVSGQAVVQGQRDAILSVGSVPEEVVLQLLSDAKALKAQLLALTTFQTDSEGNPPLGYSRFVEREMAQTEALLSALKDGGQPALSDLWQKQWKQRQEPQNRPLPPSSEASGCTDAATDVRSASHSAVVKSLESKSEAAGSEECVDSTRVQKPVENSKANMNSFECTAGVSSTNPFPL